MALMVKNETGKGQQIDVASADCMLTALEDCLAEAFMKGVTFHREGNGSLTIAPYDTFEVKDLGYFQQQSLQTHSGRNSVKP